ncbi:hypothetical protein K1T71_010849 [Dendrolimus kikuchii]|uniref:Uncharacterized protein n=1 Tax=Dendrolimus kikuchii TaxID=765133 RepID=A0ACC1CQ48_9NEOP|nr:hypothetical protein K1T71_010849 [Dendrolimus kikuchii]
MDTRSAGQHKNYKSSNVANIVYFADDLGRTASSKVKKVEIMTIPIETILLYANPIFGSDNNNEFKILKNTQETDKRVYDNYSAKE